jgi:hypothetical protein
MKLNLIFCHNFLSTALPNEEKLDEVVRVLKLYRVEISHGVLGSGQYALVDFYFCASSHSYCTAW